MYFVYVCVCICIYIFCICVCMYLYIYISNYIYTRCIHSAYYTVQHNETHIYVVTNQYQGSCPRYSPRYLCLSLVDIHRPNANLILNIYMSRCLLCVLPILLHLYTTMCLAIYNLTNLTNSSYASLTLRSSSTWICLCKR